MSLLQECSVSEPACIVRGPQCRRTWSNTRSTKWCTERECPRRVAELFGHCPNALSRAGRVWTANNPASDAEDRQQTSGAEGGQTATFWPLRRPGASIGAGGHSAIAGQRSGSGVVEPGENHTGLGPEPAEGDGWGRGGTRFGLQRGWLCRLGGRGVHYANDADLPQWVVSVIYGSPHGLAAARNQVWQLDFPDESYAISVGRGHCCRRLRR